MKDFAVIFDCAGTLLKKYRVAKDLDQGTFVYQVVSLSLVGTRDDYVLAVFQLDAPKDLEGVPIDLTIADFLKSYNIDPVSYTHLRAHETVLDLVCRLLLEKKKQKK